MFLSARKSFVDIFCLRDSQIFLELLVALFLLFLAFSCLLAQVKKIKTPPVRKLEIVNSVYEADLHQEILLTDDEIAHLQNPLSDNEVMEIYEHAEKRMLQWRNN